MAEVKKFSYKGSVTNLTIYFTLRRLKDDYYLDNTDKTFKAAPADYTMDLTEKTIGATKIQVYEFSDNTAIWNDGYYELNVYEKIGGAEALNTDTLLFSGTLLLRGDKIIERSWTEG